jgi:malonyl-ACP O-methyltransferase BioC
MRRVTVDKRILARHFCRSLVTYERAAVVQREMAAQLVASLFSAAGTNVFDDALELGCGTGLLTERLLEVCRFSRLILNDLVPECAQTARRFQNREPGVTLSFLPGDMETVDLPDQQDLIASSAAVQWAADPRGLLARMAGRLRPGGVLAIASFGPSNLLEVSQLTGLSLDYCPAEEWRAALSGSCEILSESENRRTLWFPSAHDALRHLKQTGVNTLDSRSWSASDARRFCRAYDATFGRNGAVPLTYHPVYIVARKRDDATHCASAGGGSSNHRNRFRQVTAQVGAVCRHNRLMIQNSRRHATSGAKRAARSAAHTSQREACPERHPPELLRQKRIRLRRNRFRSETGDSSGAECVSIPAVPAEEQRSRADGGVRR